MGHWQHRETGSHCHHYWLYWNSINCVAGIGVDHHVHQEWFLWGWTCFTKHEEAAVTSEELLLQRRKTLTNRKESRGMPGFQWSCENGCVLGLSGVMVHYRGNAEGVRLKNGKVAAGRFLPSSFRPMIWFEDSTPESAAFSKKRRSWSGVLEKTESEGFHSNVVCMKFIVYSLFFYIDFHKCGSAATFTSHKIQRVLCAFSARCMQCLAFLAFLGRASR